MKRHLMGAIAAGLTVALGVSGCSKGSSSGGGGDEKTIRFVAAVYDDKTKGLWDGLIKTFEEQNKGYKVNLEMVDWTQMDAKVKTYVQTKQTPDILNYNAFADFARDGLLFPASDVLSPQVSSDILPSFIDGDKYKGTQYAVPLLSSVRLFFYNKDVFKKAGIDTPPKTWDDVKADAQKIKDKVKGVFPLGLPLGAEESQAEFFMWAMNNGGGYVDQSGNWAINSQPNVDTLNYLKDLTKSGLTQPNPETTDRKDVFNEFAQGKIGMLNGAVFMPAGFINKVNAKLPYGIAPLPTKAGSTASTLGVQDFLVAFKNDGGKKKDAVSKFLNFFYQANNVANFQKEEGFLPVTKSAGDVIANAVPYDKPFIDALPNAKFYPTGNAAWGPLANTIKEKLGTAITGDPKSVLSELQQTAQKNG
ncbi:extracellular solute-binding protein [Actinoallomurus spadix]|uniref:Extracellular solute-binding protein n=1 Tax=Actinoallomurus spadix TaxID=79912 RepID=A0ABP3GZ25_9ACTN|nr:extracellular solute-binding protein [Actinoallomurus spadix]MCO5986975.1 extracellular solute-binding protein [Actinoallomurus spadix]